MSAPFTTPISGAAAPAENIWDESSRSGTPEPWIDLVARLGWGPADYPETVSPYASSHSSRASTPDPWQDIIARAGWGSTWVGEVRDAPTLGNAEDDWNNGEEGSVWSVWSEEEDRGNEEDITPDEEGAPDEPPANLPHPPEWYDQWVPVEVLSWD